MGLYVSAREALWGTLALYVRYIFVYTLLFRDIHILPSFMRNDPRNALLFLEYVDCIHL